MQVSAGLGTINVCLHVDKTGIDFHPNAHHVRVNMTSGPIDSNFIIGQPGTFVNY